MNTQVLCYPLMVNGVLTRVFDSLDGASSVVFIHGLGARSDRWQHNLMAVAEVGMRAVAIDLPGHGFAAKDPTFSHGVPGYVDFIAGAIQALGLVRPVLVGTSLGGHVAAMLACKHQDMVSGLVLVGATGLFPIGDEARKRLAARAMDRSLAGIESKARAVFFDSSHATARFIHEEHCVNNSPGADAVFLVLSRYFLEQLDRDAVGEELAVLQGRPPLALVWGAEDRSVPLAIGQQAALLLAPAPLHLIEGAAHAPYYEKPQQFNSLLTSFLNSL